MTEDPHDSVAAGASRASSPGSEQWARLKRILEHKILPSLTIPTQSVLQPSETWDAEDDASDTLVALAVQGREDQARREIREMAEGGLSFERLQLGLLARAAQKIGVLWEHDSLSFVEATLAVGTLQRLMHFVSLDLHREPVFGMTPKSICLFPEPGARHIFGVSMAARFFQHAGWQVDFLPDPSESAIRRVLSTRHIDAIGISINQADAVPVCAEIVTRLVRDSLNPSIVTIGGGSALSRRPELIDKLPVDAVLAAVEFAPRQAAAMIDARREEG
ncbi:MAG: cobalamin-dependent protein [Pseudomonadota bacterium]